MQHDDLITLEIKKYPIMIFCSVIYIKIPQLSAASA